MTTGIFVSFDPHVAFTALLGACIKVCMCAKLLQSCLTLRPCGLWPARLLCPWNFPGKNTGVGCQGIFLTQGSKLGLLHYR